MFSEQRIESNFGFLFYHLLIALHLLGYAQNEEIENILMGTPIDYSNINYDIV